MTLTDIKKYENKIYSQSGEDGIIEYIFEYIGTTNKYFVEFGAADGIAFSNTANLRINKGWNGLLLEGDANMAIRSDGVFHAIVTAENICAIFRKYNVPSTFDLLSIDIDGNDYWVWKALDTKKYKPRVVVIEYNSNFEPSESKTIEYDPYYIHDGTIYYGASLGALRKLGKEKGYSLIYRTNKLNAFFVLSDLLHEDERDIPIETIFPTKIPVHIPDDKNRKWIDV